MAEKKPISTETVISDGASDEKYQVVVSPLGAKSTVPESILQALLDSGYKKG